jgi:DNA-binding CsgD family transcriptional regulator
MKSLTTESERALADAQMLYGTHVYSRAKMFPDAALAKGEEAYNAARALGDSSLEFTSAGGTALAHAELGAVERAEQWLDRAAAVAAAGPTPLRARLLESWRGIVRSAAEDAAGMREHLERAVQLATEQGFPAARCEALARLAVEAARLGAERKDEQLLTLAERSAHEAIALLRVLPGRPPWGAQAQASLARVALARGAEGAAAAAGRTALAEFDTAMREDLFLDVQLPAAEALLVAGSEDEKAAAHGRLQHLLMLLLARNLDEDLRARWLQTPAGRGLTRLAGSLAPPKSAGAQGQGAGPFGESEMALLRLLAQGMTNREIAQELQLAEESVTRQLAELFVKIGASSRADATAIALMGKLV